MYYIQQREMCKVCIVKQVSYLGIFLANMTSKHYVPIADPEEATRGPDPPPWKITKNIGFLSNTCPDPLKITKLPSQHSMLGHHRPASEKPFKYAIDDPLIVVFGSYFPSSIFF